jgi:hypothetical protein
MPKAAPQPVGANLGFPLEQVLRAYLSRRRAEHISRIRDVEEREKQHDRLTSRSRRRQNQDYRARFAPAAGD